MMSELARWLSNPLVIVGLCAVAGGGLLLFVGWAFTGEYERGGRDSTHRRPAKPEPWHREPSGEFAVHKPKHQLNGTPDEGTRRLMPTTQAARSRVVMIGPKGIEDVNHARTPEGVRQSQKEDVEEEGGTDRERGEDEGRAVAHGEEGGEDAQEARSLVGWFYVMPTDRFVLLDSAGDVVSTMDAERWEQDRGAAAKDLFVQGLPMIPDDVPYHVVARRG